VLADFTRLAVHLGFVVSCRSHFGKEESQGIRSSVSG
jgi:hypothetical protein